MNDPKALATQLLNEHKLLLPPIDPIVVANKLGINVLNAKFGDNSISGLIAKNNGKAAIYINASDSTPRKRFTIAHEIGHYLMHMQDGDSEFIDPKMNFRPAETIEATRTWDDNKRKEWEANVFAAELLMNESFFLELDCKNIPLSELSIMFQVSSQALKIRMDSLGLKTRLENV